MCSNTLEGSTPYSKLTVLDNPKITLFHICFWLASFSLNVHTPTEYKRLRLRYFKHKYAASTLACDCSRLHHAGYPI